MTQPCLVTELARGMAQALRVLDHTPAPQWGSIEPPLLLQSVPGGALSAEHLQYFAARRRAAAKAEDRHQAVDAATGIMRWVSQAALLDAPTTAGPPPPQLLAADDEAVRDMRDLIHVLTPLATSNPEWLARSATRWGPTDGVTDATRDEDFYVALMASTYELLTCVVADRRVGASAVPLSINGSDERCSKNVTPARPVKVRLNHGPLQPARSDYVSHAGSLDAVGPQRFGVVGRDSGPDSDVLARHMLGKLRGAFPLLNTKASLSVGTSWQLAAFEVAHRDRFAPPHMPSALDVVSAYLATLCQYSPHFYRPAVSTMFTLLTEWLSAGGGDAAQNALRSDVRGGCLTWLLYPPAPAAATVHCGGGAIAIPPTLTAHAVSSAFVRRAKSVADHDQRKAALRNWRQKTERLEGLQRRSMMPDVTDRPVWPTTSSPVAAPPRSRDAALQRGAQLLAAHPGTWTQRGEASGMWWRQHQNFTGGASATAASTLGNPSASLPDIFAGVAPRLTAPTEGCISTLDGSSVANAPTPCRDNSGGTRHGRRDTRVERMQLETVIAIRRQSII